MSAFLKIDCCASCQRDLPWEWVPPIELRGRTLAGTGIWRSGLLDGLCDDCIKERDSTALKEARVRTKREQLIALLGGVKPFREFTFGRFEVVSGNRQAFEKAVRFDPDKENLFLWGPRGVGKSHLAYAIVRRAFWQERSVVLTTPGRLIRTLRMKPPDQEQREIDAVVAGEVFVLDAFGTSSDTGYARQVLQEVLDARDYQERHGLVLTCRWPPSALARGGADDGVASRLAGMCHVVEVRGPDRRLRGPAIRSERGDSDE